MVLLFVIRALFKVGLCLDRSVWGLLRVGLRLA